MIFVAQIGGRSGMVAFALLTILAIGTVRAAYEGSKCYDSGTDPQCTVEDFQAMKSMGDDDGKTWNTETMVKIGAAFGDRDVAKETLRSELEKYGVTLTEKCFECASELPVCGYETCARFCVSSQCSKECIECGVQHCAASKLCGGMYGETALYPFDCDGKEMTYIADIDTSNVKCVDDYAPKSADKKEDTAASDDKKEDTAASTSPKKETADVAVRSSPICVTLFFIVALTLFH